MDSSNKAHNVTSMFFGYGLTIMSYDHAAFITSIAVILLPKLRRFYLSCERTSPTTLMMYNETSVCMNLDEPTEEICTDEDPNNLLLVKACTEKLKMVQRSERCLKQRVITLEREIAHSSLLLSQASMEIGDMRAEMEALMKVMVQMQAEEMEIVRSNDSLKERVITLEREISWKTTANRVLIAQVEELGKQVNSLKEANKPSTLLECDTSLILNKRTTKTVVDPIITTVNENSSNQMLVVENNNQSYNFTI